MLGLCSKEQLPRESLPDGDHDLTATNGPKESLITSDAEYVLSTIDSLGDNNPALIANRELPAVFVFNQKAPGRLQLSAKRIASYLETLKALSSRRQLHIYLGDSYPYASENPVAVSHAPAPSFRKLNNLAAIYTRFIYPHSQSLRNFST